jgi:hypothetical protein
MFDGSSTSRLSTGNRPISATPRNRPRSSGSVGSDCVPINAIKSPGAEAWIRALRFASRPKEIIGQRAGSKPQNRFAKTCIEKLAHQVPSSGIVRDFAAVVHTDVLALLRIRGEPNRDHPSTSLHCGACAISSISASRASSAAISRGCALHHLTIAEPARRIVLW